MRRGRAERAELAPREAGFDELEDQVDCGGIGIRGHRKRVERLVRESCIAEDFARHDLIGFARERTLYRVPVWIDVGRDDPFLQADTQLARALRARGTQVRFVLHGGGHSGWSGRMGEYLRFYAAACA